MKHTDRSRRNRRDNGPQAPDPKRDPAAKKKGLLPQVFDIPGSAYTGISHIELAENREAVIDGCQGVVEYDDRTIKLATGKMVVKFTGRNLQINVLTKDSAVVSGFITAIEFIL